MKVCPQVIGLALIWTCLVSSNIMSELRELQTLINNNSIFFYTSNGKDLSDLHVPAPIIFLGGGIRSITRNKSIFVLKMPTQAYWDDSLGMYCS